MAPTSDRAPLTAAWQQPSSPHVGLRTWAGRLTSPASSQASSRPTSRRTPRATASRPARRSSRARSGRKESCPSVEPLSSWRPLSIRPRARCLLLLPEGRLPPRITGVPYHGRLSHARPPLAATHQVQDRRRPPPNPNPNPNPNATGARSATAASTRRRRAPGWCGRCSRPRRLGAAAMCRPGPAPIGQSAQSGSFKRRTARGSAPCHRCPGPELAPSRAAWRNRAPAAPHLISHGRCDLINLSYGEPFYSAEEGRVMAAFSDATRKWGMTVFTSVGTHGQNEMAVVTARHLATTVGSSGPTTTLATSGHHGLISPHHHHQPRRSHRVGPDHAGGQQRPGPLDARRARRLGAAGRPHLGGRLYAAETELQQLFRPADSPRLRRICDFTFYRQTRLAWAEDATHISAPHLRLTSARPMLELTDVSTRMMSDQYAMLPLPGGENVPETSYSFSSRGEMPLWSPIPRPKQPTAPLWQGLICFSRMCALRRCRPQPERSDAVAVRAGRRHRARAAPHAAGVSCVPHHRRHHTSDAPTLQHPSDLRLDVPSTFQSCDS